MKTIIDYTGLAKQYIDDNDFKIQDSIGQLPHRHNLKFSNVKVTDDSINDATVIEANGIKVGDVSNFIISSESGVQKIVLKWEDPDDIIVGDVVLSEWKGTKIVRKIGSVPTSIGDGTIIVDNVIRNQYSSNGYEDTTIAFDTEYYYRAFTYTTYNIYTDGSYVSDEVVDTVVYGVEWDGTATTAWTRTDAAVDFEDPVPYVSGATAYSSPFDNIMPWAGMVKETRSNNNVMVKIPKFWYKLTQDGVKLKIQIADRAIDGFKVSPAHMDRGDGQGERDVVYIGRYHCVQGTSQSVSGTAPRNNYTLPNLRATVPTGFLLTDFAMRFTIWLLYLVEFADWDAQSKIGYGGGNGSSVVANGYTDSMPYHTGTTLASRTTFGSSTQYRNIEGLWDNVSDYCEGLYTSSSNVYVVINPANFGDTSAGVLVGNTNDISYPTVFEVSDVSGAFEMFVPITGGGSNSTYTTDEWNLSGTCAVLWMGGNYLQTTLLNGPFFSYGNGTGYSSAYIGGRLMELPASA